MVEHVRNEFKLLNKGPKISMSAVSTYKEIFIYLISNLSKMQEELYYVHIAWRRQNSPKVVDFEKLDKKRVYGNRLNSFLANQVKVSECVINFQQRSLPGLTLKRYSESSNRKKEHRMGYTESVSESRQWTHTIDLEVEKTYKKI